MTGAPATSDGLAKRLSDLPANRAVQLCGPLADDVALALAHGDRTLPAAVVHRATAVAGPRAFVEEVLDTLETTAIQVFPAWLPEADQIREPGGAGILAVRALAAARATQSVHFGPFLSDLAAAALSGQRTAHQPTIRSRGLAAVLAEGFGRPVVVVVVDVPSGLNQYEQLAVATGSRWLADHGRLSVWLTGELGTGMNWLPRVDVRAETANRSVPAAGVPHPRSAVEAMLEAALARMPWAGGRLWNQTYQTSVLHSPVRLDIVWPAERCVVEIDGPEHCEPARFESDRQRDVVLQLDGYAVLRFTNARVRHDVAAVVRQIGIFIEERRLESVKGTNA